MGSVSSLIPDENQIRDIKRETGFSKEQIHRLYSRFIALDKQSEGHLRREDLERIPELYVNPVSQFLLEAFFRDRQEINFVEFVKVLAIFRPVTDGEAPGQEDADGAKATAPNSRDGKLRFLFSMYDVDRDGVISADEVFRMLEELLGRHERPQQVLAIARRIVQEAVRDYYAAESGAAATGEAADSLEDCVITFPVFAHAMREVADHQLSICFLN